MSQQTAVPPASPLHYDLAVEKPDQGESETDTALVETMFKISNTTLNNGGHALRSVHAKSHGLLRGELRVLDRLPPMLAQGAFAKPGAYPVVMRLSTTPGDILDDSVSSPRGMALKIVGIEGDRLPGSEGGATQDFVMVIGPAFNAPNAKKCLGSLELLVAEVTVEAFGGKSATLTSMDGQLETSILGETFYTQVPLLWGSYMAKVAVAPVSPELMTLTDVPLNLDGKPNGICEAVVDFFGRNGGEWEMRARLCSDLEAMPVEDASVTWPENRSPYVAVARITVSRQDAWTEANSADVDDGLAFSPWHGLAAHRPIGSIMLARKAAYEMSRQFRALHNEREIKEPRTLDDLPG